MISVFMQKNGFSNPSGRAKRKNRMNAEKLSIYAVFLFRFWKIFFFPAGKSFAKKAFFQKNATRDATRNRAPVFHNLRED